MSQVALWKGPREEELKPASNHVTGSPSVEPLDEITAHPQLDYNLEKVPSQTWIPHPLCLLF